MKSIIIALLIMCSSFNVGCSNNKQKYYSKTIYCEYCGKQLFYYNSPIPDDVIVTNYGAYCNEECLYNTNNKKLIALYEKNKQKYEKEETERKKYDRCSKCGKLKLKSEMTDISDGMGLEYWCGCHEQVGECYRCYKPIYDNDKYYFTDDNLHIICSECYNK